MSIRKLLLPLTGTAAGEAALVTALGIAQAWGAHVLALHVRVDSRDVAPLAGEGLSGAMIEEMMTATEAESLARATAVRTMFEATVAARGVPVGEPRQGEHGPTASFAAITGREDDLVAQQARLADLTVVPHPEAADDVSSSEALHAVLFDSGRPVLIAPQQAREPLGKRICLAWNGTAEFGVRRVRGLALAAAGRGGADPGGGRIPAARAGGGRPRQLPCAARDPRGSRDVPADRPRRGRGPAESGQ